MYRYLYMNKIENRAVLRRIGLLLCVLSLALNAAPIPLMAGALGGSQPSSAVVQRQNSFPIAEHDTYRMLPRTALIVEAEQGVLANDIDPEQDRIQAVLISDVSNGVLDLKSNGSFTYAPGSDFYGKETFRYVAHDGLGASQIATVTVLVAPSEEQLRHVLLPLVNSSGSPGVLSTPLAAGDEYEIPAETHLTVPAEEGVLRNDTGVGDDHLQALLVADVSFGSLTLFADGSFEYTPQAGFHGQELFTYRASGGTGISAPATVTIEVTPVEPTETPEPSETPEPTETPEPSETPETPEPPDTTVNLAPRIVSGEMAFSSQTVGVDVDETHAVVAADLNGNGHIDVVATDYVDGAIFWYENRDGIFTERVLDPNLVGAYPLHVADVDLDGDFDVLAAGYDSDTFVWYRNDGSGNFTRNDINTAADGAHSIITSDVDSDGDLDLVTASQDAGTISWYENTGDEQFVQHVIDRGAEDAKRAAAADIDGDGDIDIAAASYKIDEVAWFENDGNQLFTKHIANSTVDGAYFVDIADVDSDGDMDLFSASQIDDTIAWYRNDGVAGFTRQNMDTTADGARTVIAVDLDRDGDIDAVAASRNADAVTWYENDGAGNFQRRMLNDDINGAYGVFAIDMDIDGDVDVLSTSHSAGKIELHAQYRLHNVQVEKGALLVFEPALLQTLDADQSAEELLYSIESTPLYGQVELDGLALTTGATFTQQDVDTGRVAYRHMGTSSERDRFTFTVSDGATDLQPLTGSFSLEILEGDAGQSRHE